jgi:hypothetical protein
MFCFFNVKAQAPDTSTVKKLLHYIMQPLDKSQVPTGFLEEYGCPILPMTTFNGTLTDSNRVDMNLWRTLYYQIQTSYCQNGTNPLPAITSVNASIKLNKGNNLPIPIPLLVGQYDHVKTNAFSNNLLSYNGSTKQVYDVLGRNQNPYQTSNLFAAAPMYHFTLNGIEDFVLKSNLTFNNTGKSITAAQINFDDGQGLQTLTFDVPVTVSYADTGLRRWTIKLTLSDNSVLQCYSDYRVLKANNVSQRFAGNNNVIPNWGIINPVANVHQGAVINVAYSANNRTNTLRKPLIIIEGYDVSAIAPNVSGDYTIRTFIDALIREPQPYDFNNQLDDVAGYDLVFINFNDGADGLIRNALVVEEAINRVNANKVLDNRFGNIMQQNVVMGLSMGGLIGRYALAKMTKNNVATQTRLLITHDSPHRGANVPLGLQYLIRMMGNFELFDLDVRDIYPEYDEALTLLDAPATEDLLLYRSVSETTFENNTFLDGDYRNMITFSSSGPQPAYKFLATSLGNECGNSLFNPGATFINLGAGVSAGINGRILFFKVPIVSYKLAAEVEAYALPNTGSTAKIARLYTVNNLKLFGFIDIVKQLYNQTAYAPGNHLAVDGVPGSNYPLLDFDGLDAITGLPSFNLNLNVSFNIGPYLSGYFGAYAYNNGVNINYTFVPVSSALDVSPFNTGSFTSQYVNSINGSFPSSSEGFIAQENNVNAAISNNTHIRFTARNANWLFNEMENVANNNLNCSVNCVPIPPQIQGPSQFCTSQIYTIPNLPAGATVAWSVSPSIGKVSFTTSGNTAILTRTGNGNVQLSATINSACGNVNIQPINIFVGIPQITAINLSTTTTSGYWCANARGNKYEIVLEPGQSPIGVTFQIQLLDPVTYQVFANYTVTGGRGTFALSRPPNTTYLLQARIINHPCGTSEIWFGYEMEFIDCTNNYRVSNYNVYPNPAGNDLNIEYTAQEDKTTEKLSITNNNKDIKLFNDKGEIMLSSVMKENESKLVLDTSKIPEGTYYLHITEGKETIKKQIIIKH